MFFDDFKIEHIKSPVVQTDDYYPFGGEFNSYSRESSVPNQYKYNGGSELQDELGLEIYLTDYRVYDPWGRLGWWQIDPKVESMPDLTPYNYSFNNPIRYNDPKGDCPPEEPNCKTTQPNQTPNPQANPGGQVGKALVNFVTDLFKGNADRALNNLASIMPGVQTVNTTAKIILDEPVSTEEAIATAADVVNIGLIVYGAGGSKPVPVADIPIPVKPPLTASKVSTTTVGRWMAGGEYAAMQNGSPAAVGAGGKTSVTVGGPNVWSSAKPGSVYVEFDVPSNSLVPGGGPGIYSILGPNASKSQLFQLQRSGGKVSPPIQNLSPILKVK